jgi:Ca2+-transporting ATPase
MERPPRRREEQLFTRRTLALSLLQGGVVLALVLGIYGGALSRGLGEAEVRTLTFTTIVIANLGLILTNRSWSETLPTTLKSPNRALSWVILGTVACLSLVLFIPALQDLFRFAPVPLLYLAICTGTGILSVLWFEVFKHRTGNHAAR